MVAGLQNRGFSMITKGFAPENGVKVFVIMESRTLARYTDGSCGQGEAKRLLRTALVAEARRARAVRVA